MTAEFIELNFVNKSADMNNSSVVIFQKNVAEGFSELAAAWTTIKNCGRLNYHPFIYPMRFEVSAGDSFGNYTPHMTAFEGQAYELVEDPTGHILHLSRKRSASPSGVEVQNNLEMGSINANCIKDGKLLATKTDLAPGQKAVFEIFPSFTLASSPKPPRAHPWIRQSCRRLIFWW